MCHMKITLLNYTAYELAAAKSWLTQDYKEKNMVSVRTTYWQLEWIMETSKEWLYLGQICPQTGYDKYAPLKLCAQSRVGYYCHHTHLSGYKVSNPHNLVCSSRKKNTDKGIYHCGMTVKTCQLLCIFMLVHLIMPWNWFWVCLFGFF